MFLLCCFRFACSMNPSSGYSLSPSKYAVDVVYGDAMDVDNGWMQDSLTVNTDHNASRTEIAMWRAWWFQLTSRRPSTPSSFVNIT